MSFTYQGNIPISERKRLYEAPDYALVTTKSGIKTLEKDLTSLVERGGFYYEVFEMQDTIAFTVARKIKEKLCCKSSAK